MRRRLDDGRGVPSGGHRAQGPLELGGLRRGDVGGRLRAKAPDSLLGRADEPGPDAARVEHRRRHPGRRGLPVGAGDPHDAELPPGVPVPPRRDDGEGQLAAVHDELDGRPRVRHRALHDDRRRPRGDGGADERVAVDMGARHGNEDPVPADPARVVGDAADPPIGRSRRQGSAEAPGCREPVDEPAEPPRAGRLGGLQERAKGHRGALVHRRLPGRPAPGARQRLMPFLRLDGSRRREAPGEAGRRAGRRSQPRTAASAGPARAPRTARSSFLRTTA